MQVEVEGIFIAMSFYLGRGVATGSPLEIDNTISAFKF